MTYEVLNDAAYVESDTPGRLTESSTTVTITAMQRDENVYLYKDFGASYFGAGFSQQGEVNCSAALGGVFLTGVNSQMVAYNPSGGTDNALALQFDNYQQTDLLFILSTKNGGTNVESVGYGIGALSLSTTYYYDFRELSALGRYGGIWVGVWDNAARTTAYWKGAQFLAVPAANTYRYFYPAQSYNSGITNAFTGTHANITLSNSSGIAAGLDLTAFTTSGAQLASYADCTVATAMPCNAVQTVSKDSGSNYFSGSYEAKGALVVTGNIFSTAGTRFMALSMVNTVTDGNNTNDRHCVEVGYVSTTTYSVKVSETYGGTTYSSTTLTLNMNQAYFLSLIRMAGANTLTLNVYYDPTRTSLMGTKTLTPHNTTAFQYFLPVQSFNNASQKAFTFTMGGVDAAIVSVTTSDTATGGGVAGGSAIITKGKVYNAAGGAVAGGSTAYIRSNYYLPSGGGVAGGAAPYSYNGNRQTADVATGGGVAGGTSTYIKSNKYPATGGAVAGGSAGYSFNLQANIQEIVFELYDSNGAPITGATVLLKLRTSPGTKLYDWSDNTFKSSGWGSTTQSMSQVDATNLPGAYKQELNVSAFANGRYQAFMSYSYVESSVTKCIRGSVEFLIDDGQIVDEYVASKAHTIDLATDSLEADMTLVKGYTDSLEASMAALPSAAQNAAATLAAATTTPIAADVKKMNASTVIGTGIPTDKWRG